MLDKYRTIRGAGIRLTLPFVIRFSGLWFLVTTAAVVVFAIVSYLALADRLPAEARPGLLMLLAIQTAILLFGLVVLAIFNTHRIAGPFIALKQAFDDVKNGNLERRLRLRRADRLEELETAFNEMLASLRDHNGEPGS